MLEHLMASNIAFGDQEKNLKSSWLGFAPQTKIPDPETILKSNSLTFEILWHSITHRSFPQTLDLYLEVSSYGQTSQNVITLPITGCWFAVRSVNPHLDKVIHIVG